MSNQTEQIEQSRSEEGTEVVEQITMDTPKEKTEGNVSKKRVKDPKKVAAGKKLAEYNKKAKEALAREMKREETLRAAEQKNKMEENENRESESNKAWLPELSFTTVLSIVGIGFTAFDMFMRYQQSLKTGKAEKEDNKNRIVDLSQVPTKVPMNIPNQPQPIKMGMI